MSIEGYQALPDRLGDQRGREEEIEPGAAPAGVQQVAIPRLSINQEQLQGRALDKRAILFWGGVGFSVLNTLSLKNTLDVCSYSTEESSVNPVILGTVSGLVYAMALYAIFYACCSRRN